MIRFVFTLLALLVVFIGVAMLVSRPTNALSLQTFATSQAFTGLRLIDGLKLADEWVIHSDDGQTSSDFDEEEYLFAKIQHEGKTLVRTVIPGFKNPLTGEIESMALRARFMDRLPDLNSVLRISEARNLSQILGPSYGYVEEWDEGHKTKGSTRNWGACAVEDDSLRIIYYSATVTRKEGEDWKISTRSVRQGIFHHAEN